MPTVYALYSTRDDAVRYVGQTTKQAWKRHREHLVVATGVAKKKNALAKWILAELKAGYVVKFRVLVDNATWNTDERAEVARLRAEGADLFNVRKGGESTKDMDARVERMRATCAERSIDRYWDRALHGTKPGGHRSAERMMLGFYLTGRANGKALTRMTTKSR